MDNESINIDSKQYVRNSIRQGKLNFIPLLGSKETKTKATIVNVTNNESEIFEEY